MEKTKITNCGNEAGMFLGTRIKKGSHTTYHRLLGKLVRNVKNMRLTAPLERVTKKLSDGGFISKMETTPKFV